VEVHKPKPWHGVREFLKEYVIIVVEVLTALAAEQGSNGCTGDIWRIRTRRSWQPGCNRTYGTRLGG